MFLLMCGSEARRLVISLFYHISISFIIDSLSYSSMYPS
jgi:hypothetical protein